MDKAPPEKNGSEKKLLTIEVPLRKILNIFEKKHIEVHDTNRYTDYSVCRVSPNLSVFRLRSPNARVSIHVSSALWHEVTSEQKNVQKKGARNLLQRGLESVVAKETLVSETCWRNAWGKWRETSGKGTVFGFLTRFQTMKALSAASATKRKSKGNDSQHVWDKFWFNLLWLVVWNIFIHFLFFHRLGIS